jgi:tetratricopeptide (TPR) repeat protein
VNDNPSTFKEGALALERGDLANAGRLFRAVLAGDENHLGALNLLAVVTMNQGRLQEAEEIIQRALKLNKRDANSLSILAMILRSQGRLEAALEKLDRALRLDPKNMRALNNRGTLLKDLGQYERAIRDFDAALAIDKSYVGASYNKAASLAALGRTQQALALYERIVASAPAFTAAWIGRGLCQSDLKRFDDAIVSFSRAVDLDARNPGAAFNLGNALFAMGRPEDALTHYDRAIALEPAFVDAHYNRAGALRSLRRMEASAEAYRRVIALKPDHFEAYNNLGGVLAELLRLDEAIAAYDASLSRKPDYASAEYNKSMSLLLRGEFETGWKAFEQRKRQAVALGARSFKQPVWLGDREIAGKTLLVHWEQGLGDTIMFCRYVKLLEREGARVLFAPQRSLRALMQGLEATAELVDVDDASLKFDLHCPLMSLPLAFGTRLETIPAYGIYLNADAARVEAWRTRLGAGFKIGVSWSGSAFGASIGRSAPRSLFEALRRPGVRLVSLQKPEAGDAAPESGAIEYFGDGFDAGPDAFLDAAAVIKNLDLVISVDTAIAHLAGALGAKVWIALKRSPDWRWLLDRSDSPWYPTARLFRQRAIDDWSAPFAEMAAALEDELAKGARADA